MIKFLPVIVLASTLTMSCSMLMDFLKPGGLSVATEIQVGDKEIETEVSATKTETHNTADAITQTFNTMNEQAPWWVIALLVVGWMTPGPARTWRGIRNLFKR